MNSSTRVENTHGIELSPRYEIHHITPEISDWCKALAIYGFMLRASIWTPILREPKTANALKALDSFSAYFDHVIGSSLSFGIFDTQYQFKRSESKATGGALNWRELDPNDPYLSLKMIDGMDFPLVSLALSYDMFYPRLGDRSASFLELIPLHSSLMMHLAGAHPLPLNEWLPQRAGEVVSRAGTITKPGYEKQGLMTALNRFLMLELKSRGYSRLLVGTSALFGLSVHRVYTNPPAGCTACVLHHYDVEAIELTDENGASVKPYLGCDLKEGWLVQVDFHDA